MLLTLFAMLVVRLPMASEEEEAPACRILGRPTFPLLSKTGDVTIGGAFSIHSRIANPPRSFTEKPAPLRCSRINLREFRFAQTMIFAIEEINESDVLLPDVSIGYRVYDTCGSTLTSAAAAMALMNGERETVERSCSGRSSVHAVIGESESSSTVVLSRTTAAFNLPLISHSATCECLSNRKDHPAFFRTIASDLHQSRALARLVKRFGWTWVGAVNSDSDYGNNGMAIFLAAAREEGVCVEYVEKFHRAEPEKLQKAAEAIRRGSARAVVGFLAHVEMNDLLEQLSLRNVTGLQFIGVEAWITADSLATPSGFGVLGGSLGFAVPKTRVAGLDDFLKKGFWETAFQCDRSNDTTPCGETRDLTALRDYHDDVAELRYSGNIYKAIYAVAHSLHAILRCSETRGCRSSAEITPRQVVEALQNVNFRIKNGEEVRFDSTGAAAARYEVVNWQRGPDGSVRFRPVGDYDASLPPERRFALDADAIRWPGGRTKPVSVCSEPCPPGTFKVLRKGKPSCCYDCAACADGEVSNATDSNECAKCPEEFWSNPNRDACVRKQVEFLSFSELMGVTLVFFTALGVFLTLLAATLLFVNKDTPLVKANNSELSFFLLFSLTLCFLCSLTFMGRPSEWSCVLRHTAFGITFVLCVSCILGKTVVVLMAFKASLPGGDVTRWFGPVQQRLGVLGFSLGQVLICVLWVTISPPFPSKNTQHDKEKIVLECAVGSPVCFWAVLGYIGLLASLCFVLAFLARRLPGNFNEAKYITFSMLIFCAVWIAFIPAYVGSPGKFTDAVEIFAILASSYGILFCIFAPKCFIILLKPELNTKKYLMGKV